MCQSLRVSAHGALPLSASDARLFFHPGGLSGGLARLSHAKLVSVWTRSGREHFLNDEVLQEAVLGRIEHVAHEATWLSDTTKLRHSEIEWDRIRDFRNFVAHAYRSIDVERVWTYVEQDLPALQRVVALELEPYRKQSDDDRRS